MSVFNRVALVVLALLVFAYCAAGAVVVAGGFATQSIAGNTALYAPLAPFVGISGGNAVAAFGVCAALILLAVALIATEIFSFGPQHSVLTVVQDPSGRVVLDRAVVRDLAEREARSVFGVVDCRIDVRTEHGGLVLAGRLMVDRYANLLDVSKAARDHLKESVERSLGQTVSEVRLRCTVGRRRHWPSLSRAWDRLSANLRPRSQRFAAEQAGGISVEIHPLPLIERAGPLTAGAIAALSIILGLLVIAFPILLAWGVGIVLMLFGIGIFVSLYTIHAEIEAKSSSDRTLAREQH
jgi:hypothetical protein